jgi:hypothetical protein
MVRSSVFLGSVLTLSGWLWPPALAAEPTTQPTTTPSQPAPTPDTQPTTTEVRRLNLLALRELIFDLGFQGVYDERGVRAERHGLYEPGYRQLNRASRLEETVGARASGELFGPEWLLFDAAARWGLSQDWYGELGTVPERNDRPHGDLLQYDINVQALPRGKVSADAYAQKLDTRVPRMFLPSLDRSLERYGTDVFLNDATFPMRVSFEHVWDELFSRTGNDDDDERRGADTFRYEGTWQPSRNQSLRIEYEYSDRHELYSGSRKRFDTTRNYLALNHILRFGADDKSSWETLARFQDEAGELSRDNTEFSTRLRLQHTKQLATNYALQYLRDAFQRLHTESYRGELGASYQPLDALTFSGQVYGLQQQADQNADFYEWGGLASAAFAKDNALGRLSANLSFNHSSTETRNGDRRGIVIAEAVTLSDPLSSFLAHTDVNPLTLIVTDANRTRTYLPIRDYLALRIGRYTALQRVPTGAITDKETVLVSYTYDVFDDYGVRRDRVDFRLQQDFKFGLTPYYAGSMQDEVLDGARFLPYRDRQVNRHRLGATYRQKRWSAGLEYEYNDDGIDPYQAVHGNGDIVLLQRAAHQLNAKATLSQFWFRGQDGSFGSDPLLGRDTFLMDIGGDYRFLLARNLEGNAAVMYRYENDTLNGVTNGVDLTTALDYKLGYFTLRFEAEYDLLSLPGSRDNGFSFWVKLRRDIPVIEKKEGR